MRLSDVLDTSDVQLEQLEDLQCQLYQLLVDKYGAAVAAGVSVASEALLHTARPGHYRNSCAVRITATSCHCMQTAQLQPSP